MGRTNLDIHYDKIIAEVLSRYKIHNTAGIKSVIEAFTKQNDGDKNERFISKNLEPTEEDVQIIAARIIADGKLKFLYTPTDTFILKSQVYELNQNQKRTNVLLTWFTGLTVLIGIVALINDCAKSEQQSNQNTRIELRSQLQDSLYTRSSFPKKDSSTPKGKNNSVSK